MFRIPMLWSGLLFLGLVACSDNENTAQFAMREAGPGSSEYSEAVREDGEVTVEKRDDVYLASKWILIRNGLGGATSARVAMHSPVGIVQAQPGPAGRYELQILLEGEGDTPEEATNALRAIELRHSDTADTGAGYSLMIDAVFGAAVPRDSSSVTVAGVDILGMDSSSRCRCRAFVGALLPQAVDYDMNLSNEVGAQFALDLHGSSMQATGGTGSAFVKGKWQVLDASVGTGDIELRGGFSSIQASTNSGSITATLDTNRDVDARFDFNVGYAEVFFSQNGADQAFDLLGDVSTGTTEIRVKGTQELENENGRVHKRTPNFDLLTHQIVFDVSGSTGHILISD